MQSKIIEKVENSVASDRLVGVRGPQAAQRAKALHLTAISGGDKDAAAEYENHGAASQPPADPVSRRGGDLVEASAGSAATAGKPAAKRRKKLVLGAVAAAVLAAGSWYGYHWVTVGRFIVSTDDAYVHADATTMAAKIPGYIESVDVTDNSFVHAGDVIARIDDGDYRLALESARNKVATQEATVNRIGEQIPAQQAQVEQARAQLISAQAAATRAQSELERQQALAGKEFASRQTLEQAQASRDQTAAAVQSAQAAIDAALANVEVLRAQQQEAARTLQEYQTAVAKAERDLSFTQVRAPIDGVVGNRAIKVGDYVQTGTRLMSLVPLDDVYIDANFKETQLSRLRPGQKVDVSVDAVPGHDFTGTVESVSPASGSMFSLLPPDNATGNFTKIVQRLPVRIHLPANVTGQRLLRPGMSVVVGVNTKSNSATADSGQTFAAQAAGAAEAKISTR
jgi:membrane fusion protein (multidrug efflux system)